MSRSRLVLWLITLAAGLTAAVIIVAQVILPPRPRESLRRVAFEAPSSDTPAVGHYRATVNDVARDSVYYQDDLDFTVVPGVPDSHVVYLSLQYRHLYKVQVRGYSASGDPGLTSEWSDQYYHESPEETPHPPGNN